MRVSYKNRILTSFCVAVAILTIVAALIYTSFRQMSRENAWVDHTYEVLNKLQDTFSDVKDVQSAQRGYVITGHEDYLAPYYMSAPRARQSLADLAPMVQDNPAQVKRLGELKSHIEERLEIANDIIAAYQSEGQQAAFDMVRNGSGKREMDEIRLIVADMSAEEKTLLNARRAALDRSSLVTLYSGAAGFIVCIAILAFVFRVIHVEMRKRAGSENSLGKTLEDVERLNRETQLLSRLGDYLRSCRSEDEAYDIIGRNMRVIFPATSGTVSIFNNSRNLIRNVLSWGDVPDAWQTEYEPDTCWALRQGRVHINYLDENVPACVHLGGGEISPANVAVVCIPMQAHGDTIGEMVFAAPKTDMDDRQVDVYRAVTEQISLALANLTMQRVLREQSIKDPLTKLYNRRYLEETFTRELSRVQRASQPLSVLMMDIDHFKKVNDTYGHDAGDAVLAAFAALLRQNVRQYDIPCRLGGEEFVVVCPGASIEVARKKAEDLCAAARAMQIKFQNQVLSMTVSIGVSVFPKDGEMLDDLLHKADMRLYKAKQTGRNKVVSADEPADKIG